MTGSLDTSLKWGLPEKGPGPFSGGLYHYRHSF
jgi:hypothetical protein